MQEQRRNPEQMLKQAEEEAQHENRGKLKIYLGAAPGVGKTYSMLHDAKIKHDQGLDVVIGLVESHGRKDIEALAEGFETLPRQHVFYHDKELLEFDLEAALRRNPGLILVDEMAHTNVPGVNHPKRWQDIKELLDHGIDVYTTLNIQHIESLNDIVAKITQTFIRETVPDSMLETADAMVLIDLPPEELLKRLQQGKVYVPQQAEIAIEHFFRKGNLTALRELALRVMADHVDAEVISYRKNQGIAHIWPTKEKFMVCVGVGSESIKLIRLTRRMATSVQANWLAVHIDSGRNNQEQHNIAIENLRLAAQLGAQTQVIQGSDLAKELLNYAKEENVTQIVIGKRIRSRAHDFFFSNLADEVVRYSGDINVNIISE